jgi:hydroxymethylpyrimidine/phosphomethylpyrimidine kinase
MIATTGAHLLPASALHILHTRLLPLATIVTPNVPEALRLLENTSPENDALIARGVRNVDDLEAVGRAIRRLGPRWVLVKGGHCPFRADGTAAGAEGERERVVDVLVGGGGGGKGEEVVVVVRMETGYCETRHTHGTGCSLACEFFSFAFFF